MAVRVKATPMPTADSLLLTIYDHNFKKLMASGLCRRFFARISGRKSGKICHLPRGRNGRPKIRARRGPLGAGNPLGRMVASSCVVPARGWRPVPPRHVCLPHPVSDGPPSTPCPRAGPAPVHPVPVAREPNEVTPGFAGSCGARALAGEPGHSGNAECDDPSSNALFCRRDLTPRSGRGRHGAHPTSRRKAPPTEARSPSIHLVSTPTRVIRADWRHSRALLLYA